MSTIRQQILIEASTRAVWRALTTPEGIVGWWADEARIEPREGGRIVIARGEGERREEERGTVHRFRPTATLEVLLDNVGSSRLKGTSVQFQIGRADGETKVHVVHSGTAFADDELRAEVDAAWKDRLGRLRDRLESPASEGSASA